MSSTAVPLSGIWPESWPAHKMIKRLPGHGITFTSRLPASAAAAAASTRFCHPGAEPVFHPSYASLSFYSYSADSIAWLPGFCHHLLFFPLHFFPILPYNKPNLYDNFKDKRENYGLWRKTHRNGHRPQRYGEPIFLNKGSCGENRQNHR